MTSDPQPPESTNSELTVDGDTLPKEHASSQNSSRFDLTQTASWKRWLPFGLGTLLLAWIVYRVDTTVLLETVENVSLPDLLLAAIFYLLAILATDSLATPYLYRRTLASITYGEFFVLRGASYLPSLLNHHVGQGWLTYFLSKKKGANLWRVAGATLLLYVMQMVGLVFLELIALAASTEQRQWFVPAIVASILCACGYGWLLRKPPTWLRRQAVFFAAFSLGFRGHVIAMLLRLPHLCVLMLGMWLPFGLFGIEIPFSHALAVVPPILLANALPIVPQGFGTREAFALALLTPYVTVDTGSPSSVVAGASLSWGVAITLAQVFVSPWLMHKAQTMLKDKTNRTNETV